MEFKSHDKTFINVIGRGKAVPVRETDKERWIEKREREDREKEVKKETERERRGKERIEKKEKKRGDRV